MTESTRPLTGLRVLVTRPHPQAERLALLLQQQGAATTIMPLVEIVPLPMDEDGSQSADITQFHKVIVISRPAVEIAFGHNLQSPQSADWFSPGAGSAETLAQYGIQACSPASSFTSEAMLELPGLKNVQGQNILIIKGEGGRDVLATTLQERGATVTSWPVYRRHCPDYPVGLLDQTVAEDGVNAIVATSGLIVSSLLACSAVPQDIFRIPLLVPSSRVAEASKALGFETVINAHGASDTDIAEALLQLL